VHIKAAKIQVKHLKMFLMNMGNLFIQQFLQSVQQIMSGEFSTIFLFIANLPTKTFDNCALR